MNNKSKWKKNKSEIIWNIVNSMLAGSLVFLGSLTSGQITKIGLITALITCLVVIVTKFKDYWSKEEKEYSVKLFNFVK